jgi:hypothetical protein
MTLDVANNALYLTIQLPYLIIIIVIVVVFSLLKRK